ncbi:alpha/beta fold hydrolase [Roseobacter sp. GAI101]|uniref:alpha/beta fold hydrolase n=1 Tax=Roseobacter sp. (strain GAI101) TaxID=391589 RepID=UPI00030ABFA8|nr:alpha/beta fold hydrolase [Roseobacter sp. GAI101]
MRLIGKVLTRGRRFIKYDERGCGLSDWDVDDLSFGAFVEDPEAVADQLALDRFPLLGISQGAAVSIAYAVRHPERVSALILVGGIRRSVEIHGRSRRTRPAGGGHGADGIGLEYGQSGLQTHLFSDVHA